MNYSYKNTYPLTRIQKLIAARMLESKLTKPCIYLQLKADAEQLLKLRKKISRAVGVKITSNTFLVRALAWAAGQNPLVLGRLYGDVIKIADSINVGFAVNAPQGVIVPVIKQADTLSLAQIARAEQTMTQQARDNTISLEDMQGETIALSNLGAYGTDAFSGIVPPPASTILSVGNVLREVAVVRGRAVVRKAITLTATVDRRVVSEISAARFLGCIKTYLENPLDLVAGEADVPAPSTHRQIATISNAENTGQLKQGDPI